MRDKLFWYQVSTVVFVACLITANVVSVKIIRLAGIDFPAGTLVFPLSYIFGDILVEVFGIERARRVIVLGFVGNLIFVIFAALGQAMPYPPFWNLQGAYENVLGFAPRLLCASIIAYFAGQFGNAYVMHYMKRYAGSWPLWTRTIGSTVVGEGLDSLVFISLAFIGVLPDPVIVGMVLTQWMLKTAYEAVATPLTYAIVMYLRTLPNDAFVVR